MEVENLDKAIHVGPLNDGFTSHGVQNPLLGVRHVNQCLWEKCTSKAPLSMLPQSSHHLSKHPAKVSLQCILNNVFDNILASLRIIIETQSQATNSREVPMYEKFL